MLTLIGFTGFILLAFILPELIVLSRPSHSGPESFGLNLMCVASGGMIAAYFMLGV